LARGRGGPGEQKKAFWECLRKNSKQKTAEGDASGVGFFKMERHGFGENGKTARDKKIKVQQLLLKQVRALEAMSRAEPRQRPITNFHVVWVKTGKKLDQEI